MNETQEKIVNQTDLQFLRYIENQYGINRGVYNTIEQWFFEEKVDDIVKRRFYILCFLNYVFKDQKGTGRFGKKGLTSKLNQFWMKIDKDQI
ncbi:hypothetical protein V7263_11220 [Bacillus subtilis]|uniref:hypothetical protein n=1 Tax=Bacillus subtilis TaxID=1423 RepID=UPI002FFE8C43